MVRCYYTNPYFVPLGVLLLPLLFSKMTTITNIVFFLIAEQYYSDAATNALYEMTAGKLLQCQVVARTENGLPHIHLYQIDADNNNVRIWQVISNRNGKHSFWPHSHMRSNVFAFLNFTNENEWNHKFLGSFVWS